ncbi:MAG: acetyltransferase [Pseudomonadota bacterium]|nr:acetyltransferase [Pseudomonadota bacterium]
MADKVDVEANRAARKWTRGELAGRVAWGLATPLFRLSPRLFWGWRRAMLRAFGAQIGRDVHIYPSVRIAVPWNIRVGDQAAIGDRAILYSLGVITIGARATVSQGAHLCAGSHDLTRPDRPLTKPPVRIGEDAWIAADAFIGPSVAVGARAVVGARSVVVKDVAVGLIVAGNPARIIRAVADPGRTEQVEKE